MTGLSQPTTRGTTTAAVSPARTMERTPAVRQSSPRRRCHAADNADKGIRASRRTARHEIHKRKAKTATPKPHPPTSQGRKAFTKLVRDAGSMKVSREPAERGLDATSDERATA